MVFNSPSFFVFFAIYFLFHALIPRIYRNFVIIVGSTVFYAWWKLEYVWIPYVLMGIAYASVRWIQGVPEHRSRKFRLVMSIIVLFIPLVIFKYTNFLTGEIARLFGLSAQHILDVGLPLGISFVTFTLTAFIVDNANGTFKRQDGSSTVLAYVLFFPHLIAGPILRPSELIPQLDRPKDWRWPRFTTAVAIFTCGLVKKVIFADQLAELIERVYADPSQATWVEAVYAFYAYAIQIYCDFSGYTDMAIGLALCLGIRLPTNFLRPYTAGSPVDFWRRWHITLSRWLRDYLYIPLGGSRSTRWNAVRNVMITMVLGGLWHGANWTFVVWGFIHGIAVAACHIVTKTPRLAWIGCMPRPLAILLTFHFVCIAWIFFRAPNIATATSLIERLLSVNVTSLSPFLAQNIYLVVMAILFFAVHPFDDLRRVKWAVRALRGEIMWPVIVLLWVLAVTLGLGNSAKFIYFDF